MNVFIKLFVRARNGFYCKAVKPGRGYRQDCDWPMCGCDPYANKVINALDEQDEEDRITIRDVAARYREQGLVS